MTVVSIWGLILVHTLVFGNGGAWAKAKNSGTIFNLHRFQVIDIELKYVMIWDEKFFMDSAVNFAHRDGVGYYDFQYPWNVEGRDVHQCPDSSSGRFI